MSEKKDQVDQVQSSAENSVILSGITVEDLNKMRKDILQCQNDISYLKTTLVDVIIEEAVKKYEFCEESYD